MIMVTTVQPEALRAEGHSPTEPVQCLTSYDNTLPPRGAAHSLNWWLINVTNGSGGQ